MAVFREISINWNGKDYTLVPSNKLLRRIEGQGDLSIPAMAQAAYEQRPRLSEMAFVMAELLKVAGATVHEDEVYQELMTGEKDQVQALISQLFESIMPQAKDAKKNEGQKSKAKGEA